MLQIYFVRHGQTEYNVKKIVQGGGIDSDLNETGLEQARKFHAFHSGLEFDAVVCSCLKRTYQTISLFTNNSNSPLIKMKELDELSWGVWEGKSSTKQMYKHFLGLNQRWQAGDLDARMEGGESPNQCWERAERGLKILRNEFPTGKLLLCTHGRTMRIILSNLLGYGMERMNLFPHENTHLNVINLPDGGKPYAERLNDLRHLN